MSRDPFPLVSPQRETRPMFGGNHPIPGHNTRFPRNVPEADDFLIHFEKSERTPQDEFVFEKKKKDTPQPLHAVSLLATPIDVSRDTRAFQPSLPPPPSPQSPTQRSPSFRLTDSFLPQKRGQARESHHRSRHTKRDRRDRARHAQPVLPSDANESSRMFPRAHPPEGKASFPPGDPTAGHSAFLPNLQCKGAASTEASPSLQRDPIDFGSASFLRRDPHPIELSPAPASFRPLETQPKGFAPNPLHRNLPEGFAHYPFPSDPHPKKDSPPFLQRDLPKRPLSSPAAPAGHPPCFRTSPPRSPLASAVPLEQEHARRFTPLPHGEFSPPHVADRPRSPVPVFPSKDPAPHRAVAQPHDRRAQQAQSALAVLEPLQAPKRRTRVESFLQVRCVGPSSSPSAAPPVTSFEARRLVLLSSPPASPQPQSQPQPQPQHEPAVHIVELDDPPHHEREASEPEPPSPGERPVSTATQVQRRDASTEMDDATRVDVRAAGVQIGDTVLRRHARSSAIPQCWDDVQAANILVHELTIAVALLQDRSTALTQQVQEEHQSAVQAETRSRESRHETFVLRGQLEAQRHETAMWRGTAEQQQQHTNQLVRSNDVLRGENRRLSARIRALLAQPALPEPLQVDLSCGVTEPLPDAEAEAEAEADGMQAPSSVSPEATEDEGHHSDVPDVVTVTDEVPSGDATRQEPEAEESGAQNQDANDLQPCTPLVAHTNGSHAPELTEAHQVIEAVIELAPVAAFERVSVNGSVPSTTPARVENNDTTCGTPHGCEPEPQAVASDDSLARDGMEQAHHEPDEIIFRCAEPQWDSRDSEPEQRDHDHLPQTTELDHEDEGKKHIMTESAVTALVFSQEE